MTHSAPTQKLNCGRTGQAYHRVVRTGLLYARDRHNLVLLPLKNVLGAVS